MPPGPATPRETTQGHQTDRGRALAPIIPTPVINFLIPGRKIVTKPPTCPVTTGTTAASHSAASASGPVSQPGWAARAAAQASSAADAPAAPRSWAKLTCTSTWVGCPARAGTIPARISRRHASSSAS